MRKHFETFKTGSSRAMKKVKSKARMVSKELKTQKESRDITMGIALTYRDNCSQALADRSQALMDRSQALTDRAQVRQQLDLRNSFDEEMGEGEPESAATTARVETGTFGRPSDFREVDTSMSDAAVAANTTPISTGTFGRPSFVPQDDSPMSDATAAAPVPTQISTVTFGRPSFIPQADSTMSDAAAAAPASTQNSTGTFGRPSYPSQVDTPMSDAATKHTGHNNKKNITMNSKSNSNSRFLSDIKRKLKRTNWSRSNVFQRKKPAKKQQSRVSRPPKLDTPMPDASKHSTTNSSTHLSGFTAPPPTGPRQGGFFSGHGHGAGQQQSQAKTQSAQLDVAMTDGGKANVDYTNGGSFGFPPPNAPKGPRSAGSGHGGREQRLPSSSKFPGLDTFMTDASETSNQSKKPLRSEPPSGPRVSEFGNRGGKDVKEANRSSRAAGLDRSMPDATESSSHGNGSQPRSGVPGKAPQLSVGTRRIETQRRADDETKKLNRSLEEIAAMPTSSSAEQRLKRYKI